MVWSVLHSHCWLHLSSTLRSALSPEEIVWAKKIIFYKELYNLKISLQFRSENMSPQLLFCLEDLGSDFIHNLKSISYL